MGESLATMLDHDKIENWGGEKEGNRDHSYNRFNVELKAERTAKEAAEKLRKERLEVAIIPTDMDRKARYCRCSACQETIWKC